MSYQKSVRRITVPLGCTEHINIARDNFKSLYEIFAKISRSPNSERNKLHIAQFEVMSMNHLFKSLGNGERDGISNGSYYKKST